MSKPNNRNVNDLGFVPGKSWPGAFGVYKFSQAIVSYNLGPFLILTLLGYAADAAASYSSDPLLTFLLLVVFYLFIVSSIVLLVNSAKGIKLSFAEALGKGTRVSLKVFALYILILLGALVSFLLLIVPVLFVLPRLTLAPYYLLDQDLSISDSIRMAWEKSEGHALKIWGVIGVQLLFGLMSIIIIGIYFSIIYSAALISLYHFVNRQPKAAKK